MTRHPIYTGTLGMFIGAALTTGLAVIVLALVVVTAYLAFEIRTEEQLLLETFGGDYRRYQGSVHAIIPFVR